MNNQDWKPLTISKDKPRTQVTYQVSENKKLEDAEIPIKRKLGMEEGKKIQQARVAKGWTQQDLALRLSIRPNIVQEYETGNVIPERNLLNKMNRVLGIKIVYIK